MIPKLSGNDKQNPGVAKFGIALEWGSRGLEFESRHSDQKDRKGFCFSCLFIFLALEIRRPQMQYAGGILLIPVQTLVSTLIFFCGCKRKCKRISTLRRYFCHCKKINKMFDNLLLRMIML